MLNILCGQHIISHLSTLAYIFEDICPIVSLEQCSYLSEECVYTIVPENESEIDWAVDMFWK
jgi:hypothetical protein